MTAFIFYDQIFKLLAKLKVFLFPCRLFFSSTLDANHGRNGYTILATWTPNSFFGFFIVFQALFAITVEVVLFLKCRFSYISEVWKKICDVVKKCLSKVSKSQDRCISNILHNFSQPSLSAKTSHIQLVKYFSQQSCSWESEAMIWDLSLGPPLNYWVCRCCF